MKPGHVELWYLAQMYAVGQKKSYVERLIREQNDSEYSFAVFSQPSCSQHKRMAPSAGLIRDLELCSSSPMLTT
jgi:hypothetical protein